MSLITVSKDDVQKELARQAHAGTSFTPEVRAEQEVASYVSFMTSVNEKFSQWVTDENRDDMETDLVNFQTKYINMLHALWGARSRCLSTFVTGPSKFPTKRNAKRNATADKRLEELLAFQGKALDRLERKYNPKILERAPIKSSDDDAIEKLNEKIEAALAVQEKMKASNKVIKSKKLSQDEKVEKLIALGHGELEARKLFVPDFCGRIGYADYLLKNNNANIRRMKKRVESLKVLKKDETNTFTIRGVRIVDNVEEHRVQIIFPARVPKDVYRNLRSRGYRVTKAGIFQKHRSTYALTSAKQFVEELIASGDIDEVLEDESFTYEQWLESLNQLLKSETGFAVDDMPYAILFDDGCSPEEAVTRLKEEFSL